jgi:osmotically-inducible protein OsmY
MAHMKRALVACTLLGLSALVLGGCAATKNTAAGAGAIASESAQTAGAAVTDSSIDVAIRGKLIDDDTVKSNGVHIHTQDGIVTLQGTQPTLAARERAEQIAWSVNGVRGVVNELQVAPSPPS